MSFMNIEHMEVGEKQKALIKLHKQFGHATYDRLAQLMNMLPALNLVNSSMMWRYHIPWSSSWKSTATVSLNSEAKGSPTTGLGLSLLFYPSVIEQIFTKKGQHSFGFKGRQSDHV
jgi:hypothetical protein